MNRSDARMKPAVSAPDGSPQAGPLMRPESILALALLGFSLLLPVVLIYSAVASYRAVAEVRNVYLRTRAATVKEQLELLPSLEKPELKGIFEAETDVADVRIYARPLPASDPEALAVNPIFAGDTLFSSAEIGHLYRSYVALHPASVGYERRVARIDTRAAAGDSLVREAVRHLTVAFLAALGSLGTLAAYLVVGRRAGRLQHLAQLGTMSAALAHEIRNPLGTIKGFAQLSKRQADEKVERFQDLILKEVARLEKLVEDLLSFSRPRDPVFRTTAWNELIPRISQLSAEQRVRLAFDAPPGLVISTDPDLLVEIALNLIRNAVDASEDEGQVRVSANLQDGSAVICIDDEGSGIPERVRGQVFEPFFTTKATGTGLGLPISRRLVQRLRGRLDLMARSPRGTRARLQLPDAYLAAERTNGNDSGSG